MNKRIISIIVLCIFSLVIAGCKEDITLKDNKPDKIISNEIADAPVAKDKGASNVFESNESKESTLEELSHSKYTYSSSNLFTEIYIEDDGYFYGKSCELDNDECGELYSKGTAHYSQFDGQLDVTGSDGGVGKITVLNYRIFGFWDEDNPVAYSLDDVEDYHHHEDFRYVIDSTVMPSFNSFSYNCNSKLLCLQADDTSFEFKTVDRKEASNEARDIYNEYESIVNKYVQSCIDAEALSTMDQQAYITLAVHYADDCMYRLLTLAKYNLDEVSYATLLEEQKTWLTECNQAAEEEYASWGGGSGGRLMALDTRVSATKSRCIKLLQLLAADSDNNAVMKSNKDKAKAIYDEAKMAYDKAGEQAKSGITSDMVEATGNQYEIADKCLNDIWAILKEELSADEYTVILEEQRAWNKTKENTAKQACDEYAEGSFATVAYNDTLATMTINRCLELIQYLE